MRKYVLLLCILTVVSLQSLSSQQIDMDQVYAEREFRFGVRAFHRGEYNKALLSLEKSLSLK